MHGLARRILLHLQNKYATIPAMSIAELFLQAMREQGAGDIACARIADGPVGLPFAVSMTIRLSDAVVEEIADEPTYTYFHHYRTVNAFLDQLALKAGLYLQEKGARYIAVAASQSVPAAPGSKATPFDGPTCFCTANGVRASGSLPYSPTGANLRKLQNRPPAYRALKPGTCRLNRNRLFRLPPRNSRPAAPPVRAASTRAPPERSPSAKTDRPSIPKNAAHG